MERNEANPLDARKALGDFLSGQIEMMKKVGEERQKMNEELMAEPQAYDIPVVDGTTEKSEESEILRFAQNDAEENKELGVRSEESEILRCAQNDAENDAQEPEEELKEPFAATALDPIETTFDRDFEEAVKEEQAQMDAKKAEEDAKKKHVQAIWKNQLDSCIDFFNQVAALLTDIYEVVPSKSPKWRSFCLVPKGTANQVTYYGKPVNSLRVGMNWNWRAGLDRCSNVNYIQCVTPDLPYVKARPKDHPDWSSPPVYGNMVALFDVDQKYHCIFGEKYNKETKDWTWMVNTPQRVAKMLRERYIKMTYTP